MTDLTPTNETIDETTDDAPPPKAPLTLGGKLKNAAVIIVFFFGLPYLGLAYIWKDRCKSTSLTQTRSPDGTMVVEQVLTDCGKTMAVASELKLQRLLTPTAPVGGGKTILLLPAKEPIKVIWNSASNLQINLPPQADVAKALEKWDGVSIILVGERVHRELPF